MQLPKIDYLRENSTLIHFFGLGFIQVKMKDPVARYHFYTTRYSKIVWDESIHNHRYNFSSVVLKGQLTNDIYDWHTCGYDYASYERRFVSCDKHRQAPSDILYGHKELKETQVIKADSITPIYYMENHVFHRVSTMVDTVTLVNRSSQLKDYAEVINKIGERDVCPFSCTLSQSELWEIVEEMLK